MTSSYRANIQLGVTGASAIDAALQKINKLNQALQNFGSKADLGRLFGGTKQVSTGFDNVTKSISSANAELREFGKLLTAQAATAKTLAAATARLPQLPPARAGRTRLPSGDGGAGFRALPDAPRSTGNFQSILNRLAESTTSAERAARLLRATPENRITTDLAGRASSQRRLFEEVPVSRALADASKYFDPVFREIAKNFAQYQRQIRPTLNDRRAVGPLAGQTSSEFRDFQAFARQNVRQSFVESRRALPGAPSIGALPEGLTGGGLARTAAVSRGRLEQFAPEIPAAQQTINVSARTISTSAQNFAQAVNNAAQTTQRAASATTASGAGGGSRGGGGGANSFISNAQQVINNAAQGIGNAAQNFSQAVGNAVSATQRAAASAAQAAASGLGGLGGGGSRGGGGGGSRGGGGGGSRGGGGGLGGGFGPGGPFGPNPNFGGGGGQNPLGAGGLDYFQNEIRVLRRALAIASARNRRAGGPPPETLRNFDRGVQQYVDLLDRATAGSNAEARAIQGYAAITERANTFRRRQNGLITEQIRLQQGLQPLADREAEVARRNTRAQSLRFQRDRNENIRGRASEALSSGLIGGGFPLLFGQGAGAAIGGGIGGVAGGAVGGGFGFGLSIVGTIVGDAFDKISVGAKDLAASLRDPSDALATLEAAGLKADTQLKFNIETLLAAGDAAGAQALVFQELNKRLGPESVANLQALDAAQKQLDEAWRELSATLLTTFLPAIIQITKASIGLVDRLKESAQSLDPRNPNFGKGSKADDLTRLLGLPGARTPGLVDAKGRPLGMSAEDFLNAPRPAQPGPLNPNALQTQRLRNERLEDEQRAREKSLRDLERGEQDLGRQREDLERRVQDLRKTVLDRIFEQEQRIAGLRIDAARTEAQIRIEQNDQRLSGQTSNFATEEGRALQEGIRQYIRTKSEGEADIEQKRKKADLDSVKLRRDQAKFEEQIAREVYSLQRGAADYDRAVLDYRVKVADYELDQKRKGEQIARETNAGGSAGGVAGAKAQKLVPLFAGAGFNASQANTMAAIAMAESGGNPRALNDNRRTGDLSYGLAQINMIDRLGPERRRQFGISSNEQLYDPATNARAAKSVFDSQGYNAWSVYRSGAYRQYLNSDPSSTATTSGNTGAMSANPAATATAGPRPVFNAPSAPGVSAPSAEVTKSGGLVDKELAQQRELLGISEKLVSVQNQGRLQALAQQITGNEKLVAGARLELQINQEIAKIDPNLTQSAKEQLELGIRQNLTERDRLGGLKEALKDKGLTTAEQKKLNQAIDKSAQNQQQVNALTRDNLAITQETARARAFAGEVGTANADNEALQIRLQALQDGNRELTASERVTIQLGARAKDYTAEQIAARVAIEGTTIALEKQLKEQQKVNDLYQGAGDIIRGGVGSALVAITDKTRTLNDVLADTLSQLGNLFIQFAVNSIFDSLGKQGGILGSLFNKGRANGGPVSAGQPYFVGDNKDGSLNSTSELFIPGISGYVASSTDVQAAVRGAISTPADPEAPAGVSTRAAMERSMMASEQNYQAAILGEMADSPIKIESRGMRADELPFITMEESDRRTAEAVKQAVKISDAKWRRAVKNETGVAGLR